MKLRGNYSEEFKKQSRIPFKICQAEVYYLETIKVPEAFFDASGGPFETVPVDCWLVIRDEDGFTGQAPCSPLMKERILPLVLTGEKRSYEELYRDVYWKIRNNGFSGETANELGRLDHALFDLMAKRAGLPLHRFLGADRDWVKVYASACGTNLTQKQYTEELEHFLGLGYDVFKIKVGTDFGTRQEQDVEKVRIIRSIIGPDKRMAVDVNQIFDAEQAMQFFDKIAKYDIAWYEEPVHSHDFRELAKLTKMCPVPVGMGESVKNYYMLEEYVHCGAGQLQPIPTNLSGMRDWLDARALAYEAGIQFTAGGVSQLTASYAASGREEDMVEYLYPIMGPLNDYMKLVPREEKGRFWLDDTPGAGLVPDFELLKQKNMINHIEYLHS